MADLKQITSALAVLSDRKAAYDFAQSHGLGASRHADRRRDDLNAGFLAGCRHARSSAAIQELSGGWRWNETPHSGLAEAVLPSAPNAWEAWVRVDSDGRVTMHGRVPIAVVVAALARAGVLHSDLKLEEALGLLREAERSCVNEVATKIRAFLPEAP